MGQIVVLDENMVNMIAAGEVIERPASIVKELLENSIDAGTTKVTVAVEDGGRRLISVADNGCGMDADDLVRAFEPHATSKITTTKDLARISTMGFRGEALASIAAVAQVNAVSRTKSSPEANCIEIDCGRKNPPAPCSGPAGTTVKVRNLFYKLPARRKFLRTANTEMTHTIEQFTRIALAHCRLNMTLLHNTRELYTLPDSQNIRQRIAQLLSPEIAEHLIETQSREKDLRIFALLGRPDAARTSRKFQYIFLNGRYITDRFISHAVKEAYRGLIELNKFPIAFLFLQMPYEAYDVNVHPTKAEVRFDNPNLVHSQVLAVLREKLLGMNLDVAAQIPTARATVAQGEEYSSADEAARRRITEAMAEFFKQHKPIHTQQQLGFCPSNIIGPPLAKGPKMPTHPADSPDLRRENFYQDAQPTQALRAVQAQPKYFQLHDSYLVAQTEDGLVIIDQHALHERIIYEDLCGRISEKKLQSQRLLIPESLELTDAQADALKSNAALIERLGIEIEPFGPKTVAIQAFPVLLGSASPLEFVRELLDLLTDKELVLDTEGLLHEVLEMAACKAAIKAGRKLSNSEIERLVQARELAEKPADPKRQKMWSAALSRCPHGRPTTIKLSLSNLEKQFKRT